MRRRGSGTIVGAINRVASGAIEVVESTTIGVIVDVAIGAIRVVDSTIFIIVGGVEEFKARGV